MTASRPPRDARYRETMQEIARMRRMADHWRKLSRASQRFILTLLADRFSPGLGHAVDRTP